MRRSVTGIIAGLLFLAGCDKPDQIYDKLPSDYDPVGANGLSASVSTHYSGAKGFVDETLAFVPTTPTVEVCTDSEVSNKQKWMVEQPVVPMKGAGGLDMTGGTDWSGLTIDDAQQPEALCQALYFDAGGVAAWGDYYELIAFFDTTTRTIDDILIRSGYKGTIVAGDFTFEINESIDNAGMALSRGDGSSRDPKTDDNMREMDRALITAFRPELDASGVDCVDAGSCYIIMSGTLPVLVFMSVGVYIVLEPIQQHIVQMEISLKRDFRIGMGDAEVVGIDPTIYGTTAAGIPDCEVTFGTTWADVQADCLADDPMAMAQVTSVYGYEYVLVNMGGVLIYFDRPSLAADEILPLMPTPEAGDTASIISINAAYEGNFSMPYSDVLTIFKANLDAAIRAQVPALLPGDPTGVEKLKTPDDPDLPAIVQARYPDRLRPGGSYAAFCEPDGPDTNTEYDTCLMDASNKPVLPLVRTLRDIVASSLGPLMPDKLTEYSFYVMEFERALGQYFNGGVPINDDQINFSPNSSRPDIIYASISKLGPGEEYVVNMYYGGNDDRIHFLNWQKGVGRMEEVLFADAALPTPSDPAPTGGFTLAHLMTSPRLGLGAIGTVSWDATDLRPETRRALLDIRLTSSETVTVLAPFLEASSTSGYWIPLEGAHSEFVPADFFQLYGGTIGAAFWLVPESYGSDVKEIVAIDASNFFGNVFFCGFPVKIGDFADDLLQAIEDGGYPCEMITTRSENREFIMSLTDMDSQMIIYITNNMVSEVFVWSR